MNSMIGGDTSSTSKDEQTSARLMAAKTSGTSKSEQTSGAPKPEQTSGAPEEARTSEETLDPDDWHEMRRLGHRMVDDMMDYLENVRDRPAWQPLPDDVKEALRVKAPREGEGAAAAYEEFLKNVLPYPAGNIHPRFWGWVKGTGTPLGALSEMLAATMNPNVWGAEQSPAYVEAQVLNWCKEMLGFPSDASGVLTSGGSVANLVGLAVARNAKAPFDIRENGVPGGRERMVLYGSTEMHSSIRKAVELLGLGTESLRLISVDDAYRVDVGKLREAVDADRSAGLTPCCVVGNAGTVNTAAIDNLDALADVCAEEDLWFHVDGAFGALAALVPELRSRIAGFDRADSLAFDLHKWMYAPYEVGCTLVRWPEAHRQTFAANPDYLGSADRGVASGTYWFNDFGLELSRGFRALKVWMSIKEHGLDKFARLIRQNVDQADYLAGLIAREKELELLAPVSLNIVCFRYAASGVRPQDLNGLNREILLRLHERGIAVPSQTLLYGRFAIRVAITNHRSRFEDFDMLVRSVRDIGREVMADQST